ncbi:hypothetical protein [Bdellovibrio sp. BCCA]|uniref:hypothetical protein n=1 Tax=Bdellovibrio sp. BCCA TaxID=3136281 RepID=UPI0030F08788
MKLLMSILLGFFLSHPCFAKSDAVEISVSPSSLSSQSGRYYYYNFGNVRLNFSEWADITLRNTGVEPLNIRGVFIMGSGYWAWSNCPNFLIPGQTCLTRVEFRPWYEGYFTGRLRFAFWDDSIYVDLYGWGVRW